MKSIISFLFITVTALITSISAIEAIEVGTDADCSSQGYGYILCPDVQQIVCYNPGLGQTCCADGCVCSAGFQCPSSGSECVPIDSPTVSTTSTVEGTVTVTTFAGGLTSTLTLVPAQVSVSGAPPATTEVSLTIQTSIPPCHNTIISGTSTTSRASSGITPSVVPSGYSLTHGVGSQNTSLAISSSNVTPSASSSVPASGTSILPTHSIASIGSSTTGSGTGLPSGHSTMSSTGGLTTSPSIPVSSANSHSGTTTTHGSSTSATHSVSGYTGTSETSKMFPASLFAYVVAITCMVLF